MKLPPSCCCAHLFSKLLLLWSAKASTVPYLVVTAQPNLSPTYQQHLTVNQSCLDHFLLLASRIFSWFSFYPKDGVLFSFGGSASYPSLLTLESPNVFSCLSYPVSSHAVLSHDFSYHLTTDDAQVSMPSPVLFPELLFICLVDISVYFVLSFLVFYYFFHCCSTTIVSISVRHLELYMSSPDLPIFPSQKLLLP